jgi:predicted nucleic acid-binding protein
LSVVAGPAREVGRRRWWRRCLLALVVLAAYPAFVLGTVYVATSRSDLPGGRHGPKDAYRHSLASAIVAYTGSPRWVDWVTVVMERDGRGDAARAMDARNNRIGARIGAAAASWNEMNAAVLRAVQAGGVAVEDEGIEEDRITWLPSERWQDRWY